MPAWWWWWWDDHDNNIDNHPFFGGGGGGGVAWIRISSTLMPHRCTSFYFNLFLHVSHNHLFTPFFISYHNHLIFLILSTRWVFKRFQFSFNPFSFLHEHNIHVLFISDTGLHTSNYMYNVQCMKCVTYNFFFYVIKFYLQFLCEVKIAFIVSIC